MIVCVAEFSQMTFNKIQQKPMSFFRCRILVILKNVHGLSIISCVDIAYRITCTLVRIQRANAGGNLENSGK